MSRASREPQRVPFVYRRRIGFGECDPARIFFAPRAIDYAVEAAEAFTEARLGVSWAELALRHGREVTVRAVDCAYERSLVAGQLIDVGVEVAQVGAEMFTLSATAELAPGEASFRTELVLGLAERGGARLAPLGGEHAARLAALVKPPVRPEPAGRGSTGSPRPEGGFAAPRVEAATSGVAAPDAASAGTAGPGGAPAAPPFTRERRVRYGDCGPSGEAYAPRVVEWAVEAVGEWYEEQLGISWLEQCRRGRGTPFLAIRCDYLGRMAAGERVTMAVTVPRLGNASIGYRVEGRAASGAPCFEADLTACHITEEGGPRRSTPFPDALRERIVAYQRAGG